ncbi:MAG: DUF72 domain-containing protein [Dehalococcoidia bacterium]|nr:DUF72 domain-containing protein [Dehalococcoidia bacterium]
MTQYLIGASGWHYNDWRGLFYPVGLPPSKWLEFYSNNFATVELNYSFYRQPTEKAYLKWTNNTHAGFKFAVKVNRYITHVKKLRDIKEPLARFFERASLLGDKLGPALYQLPPQFKRNDEVLEAFLQYLDKTYSHVIEFRHESWLDDGVFSLLRKYNAGLCVMDMQGLTCPVVATADFAYFRFHGPEHLYSSLYSTSEIKTWADRIKSLDSSLETVYAYFNNDVSGYALTNARQLRNLL